MLAASFASGIFSTQSLPSRSIGGHGNGLSASHTPEKSGLPSALRGAAAARFGLPSAVRGTAGFGYVNHCAETIVEKTVAIIAAITVFQTHRPEPRKGLELKSQTPNPKSRNL